MILSVSPIKNSRKGVDVFLLQISVHRVPIDLISRFVGILNFIFLKQVQLARFANS